MNYLRIEFNISFTFQSTYIVVFVLHFIQSSIKCIVILLPVKLTPLFSKTQAKIEHLNNDYLKIKIKDFGRKVVISIWLYIILK